MLPTSNVECALFAILTAMLVLAGDILIDSRDLKTRNRRSQQVKWIALTVFLVVFACFLLYVDSFIF